MVLRPLELFLFFQCGDRLYTAEYDFYRRQIQTFKVDPCAERVNIKKTQVWFCMKPLKR